VSARPKLPKDDWRKNHPDFTEPQLSRNLALVERLQEIARRHNRSAGEVAIAWTLHHPAVTGAIVGARNARQAEGVMRAGELRLTDEEVIEIETFSPRPRHKANGRSAKTIPVGPFEARLSQQGEHTE